MQKNEVDEKTKEVLLRKVQREFPGSKTLQDIHYYRYLKDIEWQNLSHSEIVENIKNGARKLKKEIDRSISK